MGRVGACSVHPYAQHTGRERLPRGCARYTGAMRPAWPLHRFEEDKEEPIIGWILTDESEGREVRGRGLPGAPRRGTTTRFGQSGKAPCKRKHKDLENEEEIAWREQVRREGFKGRSPGHPDFGGRVSVERSKTGWLGAPGTQRPCSAVRCVGQPRGEHRVFFFGVGVLTACG